MLTRGGRLIRVDPGVLCPPTSETLFLEPAVVACIEVAVPGREPTTGGWGKELMLIVLRTVFSGRIEVDLDRDEDDLKVGMLGEDAECWFVGNADGRGLEGDLSFGGLCCSVMILDRPVGTGRLFLGGLLAVGIAGRAMVGGPMAGGGIWATADAITVVDTELPAQPRSGTGSAGLGARVPARQILIRPGCIAFVEWASAIKFYLLFPCMWAMFKVWRTAGVDVRG